MYGLRISPMPRATVLKLEIQLQTTSGLRGELCPEIDNREKEVVDTLSESVKDVIQILISEFKRSMSINATFVFKDSDIVETLSTIYDKYVVVPADKSRNNIVSFCKKHHIDCLMILLVLDCSEGNPTHTATMLPKEEIIDNHKPVLSSCGLSMKDEKYNLPSLLDTKIIKVSIHTTLYNRSCQVLHQASF